VREDVARSAILEFKKRLAAVSEDPLVRAKRRKKLMAERERLLRQLRQLEAEIADLEDDRLIEGTAIDVSNQEEENAGGMIAVSE
jgi:hypothetical protein